MILLVLFYVLIECKFISNMKKRVIKKQFHKIAKKSIKENSYLYKKYGLYDRFIEELNLYLDFILNAKYINIKAEIHYQGSIKAFINNCIEDTEYFIDKMLLNKMIHY